MGKWAQQKKRGSAGYVAGALPPPPPPVLSIVAGELIQTSVSGSSIAGDCFLWVSADGIAPYTILSFAEWSPSQDWGPTGDLGGAHYYTTEGGDNITYAGMSTPSNVIIIE